MNHIYQITPQKKNSIINNLSINTWIIITNIFLFILFTILISLKLIPIDFIALQPSNIINGKYLWTFITSMFMHGGLFHLFVNMFSLFFVGSLVQKIIGKKRYLYFYLISGLFAGLFFVLMSFIFPSDFNAYAVGASGALFGLVGLLVLLTPNLPVYVMLIPIPIKMKYAGPGLVFLLWLFSITANVGIGNTAHLGGLIIGLLYGIYLKQKFPNKTTKINNMFR